MARRTRKSPKPTLRRSAAILRKEMPELSARYRVKSLGLFGSYVRNQQTARSDLDILVDFDKTPDLFVLMDLEEHLERVLKIKVDLVPRHALRGDIGKRILNEVVPI